MYITDASQGEVRRSSRAHALVDNHVLVDADDESPCVVVVEEGDGTEFGRHATRGGRRGRVNVVYERLDGGEVVRDLVAMRTASVAIVRLVSLGRDHPVAPADILERDPQRVATTPILSVSLHALELLLRPLLSAEDVRVLRVDVNAWADIR